MKIIKDPFEEVYARSNLGTPELRAEQRRLLERWMCPNLDRGGKYLLERSRKPCLHWLLRGRICKNSDCGNRVAHWLDHREYWLNKDKKPQAIVAHPYHISDDDALDMTQTCNKLNLRFEISNDSWYYPGHSMLVVVYAPTAIL